MFKINIKKVITYIYPHRYFMVGIIMIGLIQILVIQITLAQKKALEVNQPLSTDTGIVEPFQLIDIPSDIPLQNTVIEPTETVIDQINKESKLENEESIKDSVEKVKNGVIDKNNLITPKRKITPATLEIQKYSLFQDTSPQLNELYQNIDANAPYKGVIESLLTYPQSKWFGNWNRDIENDIKQYVTQANNLNQLPVIVLYNIPLRDCFSYSSGGLSNAQLYKDWINNVSQGVGNNPAMIILEPDAIALTGCLSEEKLNERFELLTYASKTLSKEKTLVYIDAGHSNWISPQDMSQRLQKSGISYARGFSLNVSNFETNTNNINYAAQINMLLEPKKSFVIDTSRNGKGRSQNGDWCNPSDVTFGDKPQIKPIQNNGLLDAFLWIKKPGESDGTCNGGPSAGSWWPEYLINLAKNKIL